MKQPPAVAEKLCPDCNTPGAFHDIKKEDLKEDGLSNPLASQVMLGRAVWRKRLQEVLEGSAPKRAKMEVPVLEFDPDNFHSSKNVELPEVNERIKLWPFLAPDGWLEETCANIASGGSNS